MNDTVIRSSRPRSLAILATCSLLAMTVPNVSASPAGLEGIPPTEHVVVLVLENANASATWGPSSPAKYLNSLRGRGAFAEQYYGTSHLSLGNYIAMVSGQPGGPLTDTDCLSVNLWMCVQGQRAFADGRNLADQLDEGDISWKGYMDSMPSPCFHADYSPTAFPPDPYQGNSTSPPAGDYADRHNPFLYFPNIIENDARCKAHVRPYTELAADLAAGELPAFSFISPDTCHDGHDTPCADGSPGGLVGVDAWLKVELPPLLAYLDAHDGILFITNDEDAFSTQRPFGCCSGGPTGYVPGYGGRIGLLALSPRIAAPKTVLTTYDHMSLLRTVEDVFGIDEYLNNAAHAAPMADLFN